MLKKFFVKQKIRFHRGYSYIGALGIGLLVASEIQERLQNVGMNYPIMLLFPIGVFLVWFIGYIDFKVGLYENELEYAWKKNPAYKKLTKE